MEYEPAPFPPIPDHGKAVLANVAAMSGGASILACPAELIDQIIASLSLKDIQSFRISSRALQVRSLDHFRKAYFGAKTVNISPDGIGDLAALAKSPHLSRDMHALTVHFCDDTMRVAHSMKHFPFTRWAFVNSEERKATRILSKMNVFESPYFQNAIRNHSPGDLIWSIKNYRAGEVITADMADQVNNWVAFMVTDGWIDLLKNALANLQKLRTFSLCDCTHGCTAGHAHAPNRTTDLSEYPLPIHHLSTILSSGSNHISEISLDFKLDSPKTLQRMLRDLESFFPYLQKLSIAARDGAWPDRIPRRLDPGTQFQHLKELHIRPSYDSLLLATTLFEAIKQGTFSALETLAIDDLRWSYDEFMPSMNCLNIRTLMLSNIDLFHLAIPHISWTQDTFLHSLFENKFLRTVHINGVGGGLFRRGAKVFYASETVTEKQ
ncbi:hypothetical protein CC86DRAFT_373217 [Ophiobolus disseminans]|uniref:F-box domain-containing protein n=1 Tax=Ophiobolus disseminans TaxID=1469910 RepID=A0A6A6ZM72_9PLEO|nr:hypothetical protein CC86DRAFT_373217 [Ophiobolus disseminans]